MKNEENVFHHITKENPAIDLALPDDAQSMTLYIEIGFADNDLLEKIKQDENVSITPIGSDFPYEVFNVERVPEAEGTG
jgi:hypothetical protein